MCIRDSFKSVSEALTERYMALNPNTKINLVIKKEDLAFLDLLDNKARVIIMSRELTEKEKQGYKDKIDMEMPVSYTHLDVYKRQVQKMI